MMQSPLLRLQWQARTLLEDHRQLILRLVIICGTLGASGLLAMPRFEDYRLLPVAAIVGLLVAPFLLRTPSWGFVALVAGSLLIPFEIGTGSHSPINFTIMLVAMLFGLWVVEMVIHKDARLLPSRPTRPLLLFTVVVILAYFAGNLTWIPLAQTAPVRAQLGGLAVYLLSFAVFLLAAYRLPDVAWLARLTWLYVGIGSVYILGRAIFDLSGQTGAVANLALEVVYLFPNGSVDGLFWVWIVALAASQCLFNRRLQPIWRLALGAIVVTTLFVALGSGRTWASGYGPVLVVLGALLAAALPWTRIVGALAVGVVGLLKFQSLWDAIMGEESYSWLSRVEAWRIVLRIAQVSPLLGLGPANYYWYTPLFPIWGYSVRFNSHNNYVDVVAQTGLLGLFCFLWFGVEVGRLAWRLRQTTEEGFARAYVYGVIGGLAGTYVSAMLGDWFIPFVYNVGLKGFRTSALGWFFLGGIILIERSLRREQNIDEQTQRP